MLKKLFQSKAIDFVAPMGGTILDITDVPDPVFSSKSMGNGFAIDMTDSSVVSPVHGEVMLVFPTKHAIGIQGDDGNEYLLHIGLDSVHLQGEGFVCMVAVGDRVKQGDLLLRVDLDIMRRNQIDMTSPIVITNLEGRQLKLLKRGKVAQMEKDIVFVGK